MVCVQEIRESLAAQGKSNPDLRITDLNLSSLRSVKQFCRRILSSSQPVNFLLLNAGIMGKDRKRRVTENGLEEHFQAILYAKIRSRHTVA